MWGYDRFARFVVTRANGMPPPAAGSGCLFRPYFRHVSAISDRTLLRADGKVIVTFLRKDDAAFAEEDVRDSFVGAAGRYNPSDQPPIPGGLKPGFQYARPHMGKEMMGWRIKADWPGERAALA